MVNVETEYVTRDEAAQLPALREYMITTMRQWSGIGLSAPQIGISKAYFVFELQSGAVIDMVNPEIVHMRGREVLGTEACLSVPPARNECLVPRMEHITVAYGTSSEPQIRRNIDLSFRDAAVAQHECDHLTGNFFFDRVSGLTKRNVLALFDKWKMENKDAVENDTRSFTTYRL